MATNITSEQAEQMWQALEVGCDELEEYCSILRMFCSDLPEHLIDAQRALEKLQSAQRILNELIAD